MEKNYYEILQINKNASKEIINKVYKLLIKKYHPDLQDESKKEIYEKKIKEINEAYEVLSDETKRKNYDEFLNNTTLSNEQLNSILQENENLKKQINNLKTNQNNNIKNNINYNTNNQYSDSYIKNKINNAVQQAYEDAYIQDLKNRGYKIKYKRTFKNYLSLLLTILILLIISFIVWHIPFTKKIIINYYENNPALKYLIDIIFKK